MNEMYRLLAKLFAILSDPVICFFFLLLCVCVCVLRFLFDLMGCRFGGGECGR